MANRTMAAKALKLKMQRRKLPRNLQINIKGPRPNLEVLKDYKARAAGLGKEHWFRGLDGHITNKGIEGVASGRYEVQQRTAEILRLFDNPLFVTHREDEHQRIRIFFNSRQDKVIVQQVLYTRRVFRISETFTNIDDCYFALEQDIVDWRIERSYGESDG